MSSVDTPRTTNPRFRGNLFAQNLGMSSVDTPRTTNPRFWVALRYVSDRPAKDPEVRGEAAETAAMFERLRAAGVAVTFTQPWGPVLFFSLSRNHKKL